MHMQQHNSIDAIKRRAGELMSGKKGIAELCEVMSARRKWEMLEKKPDEKKISDMTRGLKLVEKAGDAYKQLQRLGENDSVEHAKKVLTDLENFHREIAGIMANQIAINVTVSNPLGEEVFTGNVRASSETEGLQNFLESRMFPESLVRCVALLSEQMEKNRSRLSMRRSGGHNGTKKLNLRDKESDTKIEVKTRFTDETAGVILAKGNGEVRKIGELVFGAFTFFPPPGVYLFFNAEARDEAMKKAHTGEVFALLDDGVMKSFFTNAGTVIGATIKDEKTDGFSSYVVGLKANLAVTSEDLGLKGEEEIKNWVLKVAKIDGKPAFERLAEAVENMTVRRFKILLNETGKAGFEANAF